MICDRSAQPCFRSSDKRIVTDLVFDRLRTRHVLWIGVKMPFVLEDEGAPAAVDRTRSDEVCSGLASSSCASTGFLLTGASNPEKGFLLHDCLEKESAVAIATGFRLEEACHGPAENSSAPEGFILSDAAHSASCSAPHIGTGFVLSDDLVTGPASSTDAGFELDGLGAVRRTRKMDDRCRRRKKLALPEAMKPDEIHSWVHATWESGGRKPLLLELFCGAATLVAAATCMGHLFLSVEIVP